MKLGKDTKRFVKGGKDVVLCSSTRHVNHQATI